jgi:ribosomal protein S18 acetylase RimI-like enzyme
MMSFEVEYASEKRLDTFYKTLHQVAQERIYLQMIEAPPYLRLQSFLLKHIQNNWPNFFAVENDEVLGWIEITPNSNPRMAHRGALAMGVIKSHRHKGIGKKLLTSALKHACLIGLEKVELYVYASNTVAVEFYRKFGFNQSGFISHYRKLDGEYYDCHFMDLNLKGSP